MTPEELREAGVRIVGLVLVDNAGIARMKCVPIDRLARAAERGIGWSSIWGLSLGDDSFAHDPGLYSPSGDVRLRADLDAAAVVGGAPGWGWAPIDHHEQIGRAVAGLPARLRAADSRAGRRGGRRADGRLGARVVSRAGGGRGLRTNSPRARLRGGDVRRHGAVHARSGRCPGRIRHAAGADPPRVRERPDGALACSDRSAAGVRRIDSRAADHPRGRGESRLARELLAASRRGLGRKRRASPRQRLARRRRTSLRAARAPTASVPTGEAFVAGMLRAPSGVDRGRRAQRALRTAASARALGRSLRVLGQREPRGGAPARGRRRHCGGSVGQRRVEVGRRGCQSRILPRVCSSRPGWTGSARGSTCRPPSRTTRTSCPTRSAAGAGSSAARDACRSGRSLRRLRDAPRGDGGLPARSRRRRAPGRGRGDAATSTRRRSFPPTAGGTDARRSTCLTRPSSTPIATHGGIASASPQDPLGFEDRVTMMGMCLISSGLLDERGPGAPADADRLDAVRADHAPPARRASRL